MKRSYSDFMGGLPSPEYNSNVIYHMTLPFENKPSLQYPTKKPKLYRSLNFQNEIIDTEEVIQVYQPLSNALEYIKFQDILGTLDKCLVLLFFGVRSSYLSFFSHFYPYLHDQANIQLVGVSNNIQENESYNFPVITNNLRLIRSCKAFDPIGGGIYPRDVLKIFDLNGDISKSIELNSSGVNDETIRQLLNAVSVIDMENS